MNLIKTAAQFAANAHKGQQRKYTLQPYIVHPAKVASIVSSVTDDMEMIAAAWLHDTVEDCGVQLSTIVDRFGSRVAVMVSDLSDVSRPEDGNRAARKEIDRQHTAAACVEAKTIKLADLIDNTHSIVNHDPDFAVTYLREKELLLQVLTEGHPVLYRMASDSLIQGKLHLLSLGH